jgi:hypothetical protein
MIPTITVGSLSVLAMARRHSAELLHCTKRLSWTNLFYSSPICLLDGALFAMQLSVLGNAKRIDEGQQTI